MNPPRDLPELQRRARSLTGRTLSEVVAERGEAWTSAPSLVHRKGKLGQLVERVLGASAGSRQVPDFPELGVELKTIPIDAEGRPRESTFIASFSLADADHAHFFTRTGLPVT